jgi:hypothetical protein
MKNGFFYIITLTSIIISLNVQAYAQMPNIDTSIIDKTSDLMDKSEQVLEKTETVVEKTSEVVAEAKNTTGSLGGGCLIATATYGSELAPQVQFLREIRDNTVLSTASGTSFMTAFNSFYYSFSPSIADLERQNPVFKEMVKVTITPLLSSLSLLQYVEIDSEAEMLGYGISIILLNIGIYFVVPLTLIHRFKK